MRSLGLFVWITLLSALLGVTVHFGGFRLNNTIPLTHIVLSQNHAIS